MRIKKLIKIVAITLVVLIGLIIAIPFLFKNKIIEMAKTEANKQLNARLDFTSADLWFLRSFPDFTLVLDSLEIVGIDDFEDEKLLDVERLELSFDFMSVWRGETLRINHINAEKPIVNLIADPTRGSNWDIMKPTDDPEDADEESYELATLKDYNFTNGEVHYTDYELEVFITALGVQHSGSGDFSSDQFALITLSDIESLTLTYGTIDYLRNVQTSGEVDLDIDLEASRYTIARADLLLNALEAEGSGYVQMNDDHMDMNFELATTRSDVKNIISLIPAYYSKDFDAVQTSGRGDLTFKLAGQYSDSPSSLPGFELDMKIANGRIKYPDLPKSIDQLNTRLLITSEGKYDYDDMVIRLFPTTAEIGGNPISGQLTLKSPFIDPDIDAQFKGTVNLADIKYLIPVEEGSKYDGRVDADILLKGRKSTLDQKNYSDFNAEGQFKLTDFVWSTSDLPYTIEVPQLESTLSPQYLSINSSTAQLGESDISFSGRLDNYLQYILGGDVIKGNFNSKSRMLNINELAGPFMVESGEESDESNGFSVIELPSNVDMDLTVEADSMLYDDYELSQVKGRLTVKDKVAELENFNMQFMEGQVTAAGTYNVRNIEKPIVQFDFDVNDLDINQAAKKFNTIEVFAPIAQKTTGRFSGGIKFNSLMDQKFRPDLSTVLSQGRIKAEDIFIEGFEPLNELAKRLQISRLAKQNIEDLLLRFKIEDGRMNVEPFDVAMGDINAKITGYTSLNKDIYYLVDLEIPHSEFGSTVNNAIDRLIAEAKNKGIDIDPQRSIMAAVRIEGTFLKPKISIELSDQNKDAVKDLRKQIEDEARKKLDEKRKEVEDKVDEVKEDVKEEVEEKKEDIRKELERQADQILAEAQQRADKVKQEAQRLSDRIISEAEEEAKGIEERGSNPFEKKAAEIAANKLREQARKRADDVTREANKRADQIMEEATKAADKVRAGE